MELNHRCLDVSQESCRWTTGLYLFWQWTHRELHSDFRRAEPASSCWSMSPVSLIAIALSTAADQAAVFTC